MRILILSILFITVFGDDIVKDRHRACPEGFRYFGEVDVPVHDRDYWVQGERTPTYSCYQVKYGNFSWLEATHECFKTDSQLISVNNYHEEDILLQDKFKNLFTENQFPDTLLTSGISLRAGEWEWFGAGVSADNVTVEDDLDTEDTKCIQISWSNSQKELIYTAVPCADQHAVALCEVRVYTQTWYYWATANWLSILFLFTLILFIISACVTCQMYSSRPRPRPRVQRQSMADTPPPYTPHDNYNNSNNNNNGRSSAGRYMEKGREMLAKITFYRQPEEKRPLP